MDWLGVIGLGALAYGAFHLGNMGDGTSTGDARGSFFEDSDENGGASMFDDTLNSATPSMLGDSFTGWTDSGLSCMETFSTINPANGLPMMGCVDIEGNPYGTDTHSNLDDISSTSSCLDDSLTGGSSFSCSLFDDSF